MNLRKIILAFSILVFSIGCKQTRYITERYIKTGIETHKETEFSSIKTYTIYKGTAYGASGKAGPSYIELTGYKYENNKGLIIGADKYYSDRKKFAEDQTQITAYSYIELSLSQCQAIIDNYKLLVNKIKKEKPGKYEEIYHDYTVSKDLFISYRKTVLKTTVNYIDLWIKGEKYTISTDKIIDNLDRFIKY